MSPTSIHLFSPPPLPSPLHTNPPTRHISWLLLNYLSVRHIMLWQISPTWLSIIIIISWRGGRLIDWLSWVCSPFFKVPLPLNFALLPRNLPSQNSTPHSLIEAPWIPPIHFCCISFLLFTLEITFKHVTFMWHKIMVKK